MSLGWGQISSTDIEIIVLEELRVAFLQCRSWFTEFPLFNTNEYTESLTLKSLLSNEVLQVHFQKCWQLYSM